MGYKDLNTTPSDISREQFALIAPILESARKKISGIQRHIAVNTHGLPHAILVITATVTDRDGAAQMAQACKEHLSDVENVLVDGGYTGIPFAKKIDDILRATAAVVTRSELH